MSNRLPERGPFWLSYRLHDVANKLADLLAWAEFPDPASMTGKWLDATKDGISIATRLAIEAGPGADLLVKLKKAKKLAFELATRMREIPDLSVQPVSQWTMAGHRQLWDDLSALARDLATEADKPTAPAASTPVIISLGMLSYAIGTNPPIVVTREEDAMLQAFLGNAAAMSTKQLADHVSNVSRVVGQLERKFPGAVHRPKKKGTGYFISVKTDVPTT